MEKKLTRAYQFGAICAQVVIWLAKVTSFAVIFWLFAVIFHQ